MEDISSEKIIGKQIIHMAMAIMRKGGGKKKLHVRKYNPRIEMKKKYLYYNFPPNPWTNTPNSHEGQTLDPLVGLCHSLGIVFVRNVHCHGKQCSCTKPWWGSKSELLGLKWVLMLARWKCIGLRQCLLC